MKSLGRRGACLLIIGLLWLFIAYAVHTMPLPLGRPRAPHEYLPHTLRIILWAGCGLGAMVSAFFRNKSGEAEAWGYYLLLVPPLERAVSWLTILLFDLVSLNNALGEWIYDLVGRIPSLGSSLQGFATWGAVSLLILIIAGWREYPFDAVILTEGDVAGAGEH